MSAARGLTRRFAMVRTGGALAGVAAAASGAVAAHAGDEQDDHDDGLVELCRQFDDLERQINEFYSGGPAFIADDDEREAAQEPLRAVQDGLLQTICAWRGNSDEVGHAFQNEAGHLFRTEAGRCSDLKPAT